METKPTVGALTLVCVATGEEIDTGAIYHLSELKRAERAQLLLHCRGCGEAHLFKFSDARLGPIQPGRQ